MTSNSRYRRSTSAAFVFTAAGSIVRFGSQLVLDLVLGTAGFGSVVLARTWGESFSSLADRGARIGLTRQFPAAIQNETNPKRLLASTRRSTALVGLGLAALLGGGLLAAGMLSQPIAIGLLLVPAVALVAIERSVMVAMEKAGAAALWAELTQPLFIIAAVALLGLSGLASSSTAVIAVVAVVVVIGGVLASGNRRLIHDLPKEWPLLERASAARERWTLTISHASVILFNVSDVLIIGILLGDIEVAVFAIASKTAALVGNVNNSAEQTSAPMLASAFETGSTSAMQTVVDRAIVIAFVPTIILGIGAIAAFPVFPWLLGAEYQEGHAVLALLVMSSIAGAATGPSGNTLLMTGLEQRFARIQGLHLCARVGLSWVLAVQFGILGVAFSSLVTTMSLNASFAVVAKRDLSLVVWPHRRHILEGLQPIRRLIRRS